MHSSKFSIASWLRSIFGFKIVEIGAIPKKGLSIKINHSSLETMSFRPSSKRMKS